MIEYTIDPVIWNNGRLVDMPPRHFTFAPTALTSDSKEWIINTLKGRYSIGRSPINEATSDKAGMFFVFLLDDTHVYFEDPKEAMVYELTWSG